MQIAITENPITKTAIIKTKKLKEFNLIYSILGRCIKRLRRRHGVKDVILEYDLDDDRPDAATTFTISLSITGSAAAVDRELLMSQKELLAVAGLKLKGLDISVIDNPKSPL